MTASIFEMTQEDGEDYDPRFEDDAPAHTEPTEKGCIAAYLTGISEREQCTAAATLFEALKDKSLPELFVLNSQEAREARMAALISIPNSGMVRLVYGLEVGLDSLRAKKSTAKKILALIGEGSHAGAPPTGIMLAPTAAYSRLMVKAVTESEFMTKTVESLSAGIQQNQATDEVDVMMLAPVPVYLAVDAIEKAVPAGLILERLGNHSDAEKDYMKHLRDFLLASVVLHNKTAPKNELDNNVFLECLGDADLAEWSKRHFSKLIPPPIPPVPPPLPQVAPAVQQQANSQQQQGTATSKDIKTKWSERKIKYLLGLCGKQVAATREENWKKLPDWMREVAEESDSHQQLTIVREQLQHNKVYQLDTANNPDLLDYIRKLQFAGLDGAEHPTLRNACKQLSPYLCTTLTDTQLSSMMAVREALEKSSYVTVQDNERLASKAVPTTPPIYQDFVDMLKKFANTLFAIFGANCKLYDNMKVLIKAIEAIKQGARATVFNHDNKATILWLTFLQTRAFTIDPNKSVAAFNNMVVELTNKTKLSEYLEMPVELLEKVTSENKETKEPKRPAQTPPGSPSKGAKKLSDKRDDRLKVFDAAIAEAVQGTKLKYVAPGLICKKCDTTMDDLVGNAEHCGNYKLLGKCNQASCMKKHIDATDDEVTSFLQKLKPFLDNPKMVGEPKK